MVPPSVLAFLWNPNRMPTIPQFTMATQIPAKPGIAVWRSQAPCCATFADFCQEMTKLFDRSAQGDEAAAQLSRLSQRKCSVTDCAIQFQTLAAACDWNEGALRARFLEGLDEAITDELAAVDLPRELDNLINLALRVEGRLNRRHQCVNPLLRGATWRPRRPMRQVTCQLRLSPCNWVGSGSRHSRDRNI